MAVRPRVFTIPPSAPFLPTLISSLLDGRLIAGFSAGRDPLALAGVTIFLPTRRACRLAHDLFLRALGTEAALLPKLTPLGDVDADEMAFAEIGDAASRDDLDLPDTIDSLERRLLLAHLVLAWSRSKDVSGLGQTPLVAATSASAFKLADDLGRLMDDMTTREASWSRLDDLVPDHSDEYWRLTLDFMKVAREAWPPILAERGAIEPALRRDKLLAAEGARLARDIGGPVIAAGSTASMPATAQLLATIARLPQGAVVLPGLDAHLDREAWNSIPTSADMAADGRLDVSVGHPQYAMRGFLQRLRIGRAEVALLVEPRLAARDRMVYEALRPAASTGQWHRLHQDGGDGLAGVAVIEAASAEEEALAIAVALREAVETLGKTAALVTPDRTLARRVIAALARWRVAVDDSGGALLTDTPAGVFARLSAEAALAGLEPVTLLALLKHPLLRLDAAAGRHDAAISALERAVLRGPRPPAGSPGLARALASLRSGRDALHPSDPRRALRDQELEAATNLVSALQGALAPLETLAQGTHSLAEFAETHHAALAALASEGTSGDALTGDDWRALEEVLEALIDSAGARQLLVTASEYPDILRDAMYDRVARPPVDASKRVRILGLLEARLQHPDRIVLGGLVEGIWPPQTRSDPWLSRPMRQKLGLDLPERRIGLTAHDFAQALGCAEVVLSRAAKLGGAPTVPSRFVQRLAAVAGEAAWNEARRRGALYVSLARTLDEAAREKPLDAPTPRPPLAARPDRFSVTEIEDWLRDPYTIYAKRILRLTPLDPVDTPPGARDRGSAIHAAIEDFTKTFGGGLPADPLAELLEIGRRRFLPLADFPEMQAFWWPRFERIARWLVDWEQRRRPEIEALLAEVRGELEIPLGARSLRLTVRADRIERLAGGDYAILDYKTGRAATAKQVRSGLAPQLALEAAILARGGFAEIGAGAAVAAMAYVRLRGGNPAGEECAIEWEDASIPDVAARAYEKLRALALTFEDPETPYRSLVHPMWTTRYGDYDHLARVKEWSAAEDDEEAASLP
jgi:ATP-dependent helicase/nuclease subunit B